MKSLKNQGDEEPKEGLSDADLVERCRIELPYVTTAFEEILLRYESLVFNTCRTLIGSEQDAEEASQDIFLRVFHHLPKYESRASFRTWLYRIVYNCSLSKKAALGRRRERLRDYTQQAKVQYDALQGGADGDLAERALALLAEDDRVVVVLRYLSGLSLEELASALDIKLSAAKMRLYRATDRFREAYENLRDDKIK